MVEGKKCFFTGTFLEGLEELMGSVSNIVGHQNLGKVGKNERQIGVMSPFEKSLWLLREKGGRDLKNLLDGPMKEMTIKELGELEKKVYFLKGRIREIDRLMWNTVKERVNFIDMPESAIGIRENFKVVVFNSEAACCGEVSSLIISII